MTAKSQSGVQGLSERAQSILHRLLDQDQKPAAIVHAIRQQTGERLTPSVITRYGSNYRRRQQKQRQLQEKMDGFVARVQKDGIAVSDLLRAVLMERLSTAKKDGTAAKLDILKLEEHERKRSDFELKERQAHFANRYREQDMELKQRKQALAEKQFRLRRKQARASFEQLEHKAAAGQPLTADDILQIRAIYGLDSPAFATRDSAFVEASDPRQ